MNFLKGTAGLIAGAVTVSLATMPAFAQEDPADYPSRGITIVVPYNPGGTATAFATLQGEHLEKVLGQSVQVENVPGGGGAVAAEQVARAQILTGTPGCRFRQECLP